MALMAVGATSLSICQASEWQALARSSAQLGRNASSSASSEPWVLHKQALDEIRFLALLKKTSALFFCHGFPLESEVLYLKEQ